MKVDLPIFEKIAREAGQAILEVYNNEELFNQIEHKGDNSPLTLADKRSHDVIVAGLKEAYPNLPVISEEGANVPFEERKNYTDYLLIDPLDGTKEFINRNGEFTVNIAYIENGYPLAGFIYVPVHNVFYGGVNGVAWKTDAEGTKRLYVNKKESERIAVRSRSHASPEEDAVLKQYNVIKDISKGSSLKFCAVAEGSADLYYRHGPTMEWDTAAGQAVLEAAGGRVYRGNAEEERFYYNKENLLNPGFLCLGF